MDSYEAIQDTGLLLNLKVLKDLTQIEDFLITQGMSDADVIAQMRNLEDEIKSTWEYLRKSR